jgi:hypothetical protein
MCNYVENIYMLVYVKYVAIYMQNVAIYMQNRRQYTCSIWVDICNIHTTYRATYK